MNMKKQAFKKHWVWLEAAGGFGPLTSDLSRSSWWQLLIFVLHRTRWRLMSSLFVSCGSIFSWSRFILKLLFVNEPAGCGSEPASRGRVGTSLLWAHLYHKMLWTSLLMLLLSFRFKTQVEFLLNLETLTSSSFHTPVRYHTEHQSTTWCCCSTQANSRCVCRRFVSGSRGRSSACWGLFLLLWSYGHMTAAAANHRLISDIISHPSLCPIRWFDPRTSESTNRHLSPWRRSESCDIITAEHAWSRCPLVLLRQWCQTDPVKGRCGCRFSFQPSKNTPDPIQVCSWHHWSSQ